MGIALARIIEYRGLSPGVCLNGRLNVKKCVDYIDFVKNNDIVIIWLYK